MLAARGRDTRPPGACITRRRKRGRVHLENSNDGAPTATMRPMRRESITAPRLILDDTAPKPARRVAKRPRSGTTLLGWIGLAFVCVGAVDVAFAWVPLGFGSPEWQFGTVLASLNGLPLPALGLTLVMTAGLADGSRRTARGAAVALVALALFVLASGFLFVAAIPLALHNASGRIGTEKAVLRGVALVLLYPAAFGAIAIRGWRLADSP
jgi:hypothetical protein